MHVSKAPSKVGTAEQSTRQYIRDYLVPSETPTQANNPVKNVSDDRTTAPAQTTKENDSKNTPYTGSYALPMGTDIRASNRDSKTTDFSAGLKWTVNDNVELSTDLQYIKADTKSLDSTVALGLLAFELAGARGWPGHRGAGRRAPGPRSGVGRRCLRRRTRRSRHRGPR